MSAPDRLERLLVEALNLRGSDGRSRCTSARVISTVPRSTEVLVFALARWRVPRTGVEFIELAIATERNSGGVRVLARYGHRLEIKRLAEAAAQVHAEIELARDTGGEA